MQVDPNELFLRIGYLIVERDKLQALNAELCKSNADLLGQLKAAREPAPSAAEDRAQASTVDSATNGQAVEN